MASFALPFLGGVAVGTALFFLVILILKIPTRLSESIYRDVERLMAAFGNMTRLDVIIISALAGIGEEAFFRGFLQSIAADYVGLSVAILGVSIVFGVMHFISPAYALFTTVLGVFFGVLHACSGNLVVAMAAHGAYDFVALTYVLHSRNRGIGLR